MTKRLAVLFTALITTAARADYAVLDNGEAMKKGQYKFTGTGQVLTENAGLNLAARADMGINEDFGARALLGFGKMDMFGGALLKWVPVHDDEKGSQPNIGGNAGLVFVKDGDVRDMLLRAEPMVSKKIKIEDAVFTPYVSAPISVRVRKTDNDAINDDTEVPIQLVVGSQLRVPQIIEQVQFMAEVGIDLNESPGYLALGVVYYLDSAESSEQNAE